MFLKEITGRPEWVDSLKQLKDTDKEVLRSYARSYFHIDKGVQFYQEIYEAIVPDNIDNPVKDLTNKLTSGGWWKTMPSITKGY